MRKTGVSRAENNIIRLPKFQDVSSLTPVPVAWRSKAEVCGSLLAEIVGSIPPGTCLSVCCECCVLSDSGLCDGLITHSEESYDRGASLSVI
jgi:hypothetical protein